MSRDTVRRQLTGLPILLSLSFAASVQALPARTWDFETKPVDLSGPGGQCGCVADPDDPANHVYRIVASRPHHTRLQYNKASQSEDFLATFRFRVAKWSGAPPAIYLYGRSTGGRFTALSIHKDQARAFCWRGKAGPNPTIGQVNVPFDATAGAWVRASFVCFDDHVFARVWPADSPEPLGWQIAGAVAGLKTGTFALGVWTSPQTPSRAEVLFDDLTFRPLTASDLAPLRLRIGPRKRLDPSALPKRAGAFQTPTVAGLATATTVVAFDTKTGELAHVVHRATGRDFVATQAFRPLIHIDLTRPYAGKRIQTTSTEFRKLGIRKLADDALELHFADHVALPLTARVTVSPREHGLIGMRLLLTNQSDWAIAAIRFPYVAWGPRLGEDAVDDRLVLPWLGGAVLPSPGTRTQTRDVHYPGLSFAQFTALYDKTSGVYLAAYDPDGHCKRWELRTAEDRYIQMSLAHLRPELPGQDVRIPYDVVVGTLTGDWRDAADVYKQWTKQQPWCRKTLAERDDVPEFLKRGAGVIITGIANEAGRAKTIGRDLERLPDLVARYRQRTGLNCVIFVPYGWENRGTWAGINYLPAVPSNDAWSRANAALRTQGNRSAFLTSGFWWVVRRQRTQNGPAFDDTADFERRQAMVIHKPDGTPWTVDNYDKVKTFGNWRGLSVKLCHGSQTARDTLRQTFLEIAKLGTPLISFDQEIGGGQRVGCYAKNHGHPPGYGRWMWTGFRDLCAAILKEGKTVNPELGLFLENTSELAIPYMATYWSRQFGEVDHGMPHARGIGLFSYLYHEYVTAIGAACVQGQGARGTRPSARLRCHVLANNLVRGLIPGPFIHDVPLETKDPWRAQVARAYFSFCKPYVRWSEYVILGRTRRPLHIECDRSGADFYRFDSRGKSLRPGAPKVAKVTLDLPNVTSGSFEAADGSLGTVIANTTDQPQSATLILPASAKDAALYQADRTEIQRWQRPPAGKKIVLSLEPFGTRMLVVR